MARRKIADENIRSIQKSGDSYHITIPISLMRELRWQERQKVVVHKYGEDKIIIEDWEE